MSKRELVQEELEEIAKKNSGLVKPEAVVKYAESEDTALHSWFEWDDSKAGHRYRLWQARHVIRLHVTITETEEEPVVHNLFVSLPSDRINGGGYRYTVDVMTTEEQRKELLKTAHKQFKYWQKQYKLLTELSPVFEVMDQVMNGIEEEAEPVVA